MDYGIFVSIHNINIVTKAVDRLKDAVDNGEKVWLYNKKTGESFSIDSDTGFVWVEGLAVDKIEEFVGGNKR